ncbi:MAG: hypothetical protein DWQ34_26445 [Planctomycetota bacterium]|nr:MAG: hypothetical protein DWQ29_16550 [Planctomycetota bacterium]REJ86824.1 MAG: hypothetical protein DWQ34_26445 [Planctomycetota bacterium]REK22764.1 MAG: hypothetical protein DWQ41_18350 [Planctomycetota bacterium]REK33817.1 MAG: hypothetical protein DWQ45_14645 [Planctomycetota bacterium]
MTDAKLPGASRLLLMGVILAVAGGLAIASPAIAGTAVVYVIGGLLLIAGALQVVNGLRSEGWTERVVPLIMGFLTSLAGGAVLAHPFLGLSILALVLAIFFVVVGFWKIVASFSFRPASGWLAMLVSGALGLILGLLIWMQWPLSGLWAVGVLVGVDLLSTGLALVLLSVTIRSFNRMSQASAAG